MKSRSKYGKTIFLIVIGILMFVIQGLLSPYWDNFITMTIFTLCAVMTIGAGIFSPIINFFKLKQAEKAQKNATPVGVAVSSSPDVIQVQDTPSLLPHRAKSKNKFHISTKTKRIALAVYAVMLLVFVSGPIFYCIQHTVTVAKEMSKWDAISQRWNQSATQDPNGVTHGRQFTAKELTEASTIDFSYGTLHLNIASWTKELRSFSYDSDKTFPEHSDEIISQLSDIFLGPGYAEESLSEFNADFARAEAGGYLVSEIVGANFAYLASDDYEKAVTIIYPYDLALKADDGTFGLRFDLTISDFIQNYNNATREFNSGDLDIQLSSIPNDGFKISGKADGYTAYSYDFPYGAVSGSIVLLTNRDYIVQARFAINAAQFNSAGNGKANDILMKATRMFMAITGDNEKTASQRLTDLATDTPYNYDRGFGYLCHQSSDGIANIFSVGAMTEDVYEQFSASYVP